MATRAEAVRRRKQRVTREVVFQRILGLADRYQIKFRNVLQAAVRMGQAVSLDKLEQALRTRNPEAILAAIPWDDRAVPALQASLPFLTNELARAGARTAQRLLPGDLDFQFDLRNPLTVRRALEHSSTLVTEITDDTRDALRHAIARSIQEGQPPQQAARVLRSIVGLRTDQVAALNTLADNGASVAELVRAAKRKLEERTVLISRTETLWAANEGQRMLWEQGQDAGIIPHDAQREYVVTPDDRLCAICEPLDGKLYGIDESITTELGTVDSPPIHPNCRCTMSLVTS